MIEVLRDHGEKVLLVADAQGFYISHLAARLMRADWLEWILSKWPFMARARAEKYGPNAGVTPLLAMTEGYVHWARFDTYVRCANALLVRMDTTDLLVTGVSAKRFNFFHYVCTKGHIPLVSYWLEALSAQVLDQIINSRTASGRTPLDHALGAQWSDQAPIPQMLLTKKAIRGMAEFQ